MKKHGRLSVEAVPQAGKPPNRKVRTRDIKIALTALALAITTQAHATSDGCVVVLRTPDGFLNVRAKPNARSRILKRVKPGEIIVDDISSEDDRWTHVYTGKNIGRRPIWGWVRNRFIARIGDSCGSIWESRDPLVDDNNHCETPGELKRRACQ